MRIFARYGQNRPADNRRAVPILLISDVMCSPAPLLSDPFDIIEYYAFRVVLLISCLWTLYQALRHKLKGMIPAIFNL